MGMQNARSAAKPYSICSSMPGSNIPILIFFQLQFIMAEGEDRDSRRYPQNYEGILKFCVENTKQEDASGPGQFREMSPEVSFLFCAYYTFFTTK
jgi:hypothetical protein